jgi:hypothetical protein
MTHPRFWSDDKLERLEGIAADLVADPRFLGPLTCQALTERLAEIRTEISERGLRLERESDEPTVREAVPGHGRRRYHDDGRPISDIVTCGHCGQSWDDALVTSRTPAPSGRCPFEDEHVYDDEPMPTHLLK